MRYRLSFAYLDIDPFLLLECLVLIHEAMLRSCSHGTHLCGTEDCRRVQGKD